MFLSCPSAGLSTALLEWISAVRAYTTADSAVYPT